MPVADESPALVVPLHAPLFHPHKVISLPKAEAADQARRKRARKNH